MKRSQPLTSRLPKLNERSTGPYQHHTSVLEETDDKPRIFQGGYAAQMAALVPAMRMRNAIATDADRIEAARMAAVILSDSLNLRPGNGVWVHYTDSVGTIVSEQA